MDAKQSVTGIVLAGGASQRMGTNKALLEIGGEPIIARVVRRLGCVCNEIVVVTNTPETFEFLAGADARLVPDAFFPRSALVGLYSGLLAAHEPLALAVACDMPLLNVALLQAMCTFAENQDAVLPLVDGNAEPLHAVYRVETCVPAIRCHLEAGDKRFVSFLPDVRTRYLNREELDVFDPQRRSLINVNTHAEWLSVQSLFLDEADERF